MEGIQNFTSSIYKKSINKQNNTVDKNSKPGAKAIAKGYLAGSLVSYFVMVPSIISNKILQKVKNLSGSLSPNELAQVEKATEDTIKSSGLEEKGVSIVKTTKDNIDEVTRIFEKETNNGIFKYYPQELKKRIANKTYSKIKKGDNSLYAMATKNIVMPEKGMELLSFHESGHAMNANLSKAGKFLQKCRPIGLLVYPIAMIALLKNKKAPEEEPKNVLDKATTFVKDNAGKLSFAAYLPLLIEEGLASAKGQKYAKKFLSPDLAKKVLKNNVLGFSTYFIVATLTALGTCLGTKVRDTVVSNSSKAETK